MATDFKWSWVNTPSETAKESKAVLQDGGTIYSFRQAHNGQVNSKDLNAFIDSTGQNLQAIRSQWRLYSRPILNSFPAGARDNRWSTSTGRALPDKIDAFKYGVQATTLFVFNDADATKADGRYWMKTENRPKTIAESLEDIYSSISDISDSSSSDGEADLDPLWAAIGEDYRDASKVGTYGSLDSRVSDTESNVNQLVSDIYEPTSYPYTLGSPLPYSIANMMNELLQLHNADGWGSDPSVVSHTGVGGSAPPFAYTDISPAPSQSIVQERIGPYTTLDNDIKRLRYEIQAVKGSTNWYSDPTDPVTSAGGNLKTHMDYQGSGTKSADNPHAIGYTDTGAGTVFDAVTAFTGMSSNTDSTPTYSSTSYVTQGSSLEVAMGALDLAMANSSALWERNSSILSPINEGDGLSVDATTGKKISLATSDVDDVGSAMDGGDILIEANGQHSDININAKGANGDIFLSTVGAGNGNISLTTSGSAGNFLFDSVSSGSGNASFLLTDSGATGTTGQFNISSRNTSINAREGLILTNQDLTGVNGSIAGISDGPGLIIISTSADHNVHPGDKVSLSGSAYDGSYTVYSVPDTSSFTVAATYTASSGGTWVVTDVLGDEGPAFIKIGDTDGHESLHLYSSHSDILIETKAAQCTTDIRLESCDLITMNAIGSITVDSNYSSNFTVSADDIADQTLTLSCTNVGDASGLVGIIADTVEVTADLAFNINADDIQVDGVNGATGTFTTNDGKTVTVTKGIVTSIV